MYSCGRIFTYYFWHNKQSCTAIKQVLRQHQHQLPSNIKIQFPCATNLVHNLSSCFLTKKQATNERHAYFTSIHKQTRVELYQWWWYGCFTMSYETSSFGELKMVHLVQELSLRRFKKPEKSLQYFRVVCYCTKLTARRRKHRTVYITCRDEIVHCIICQCRTARSFPLEGWGVHCHCTGQIHSSYKMTATHIMVQYEWAQVCWWNKQTTTTTTNLGFPSVDPTTLGKFYRSLSQRRTRIYEDSVEKERTRVSSDSGASNGFLVPSRSRIL
jgi:hypothetical protein